MRRFIYIACLAAFLLMGCSDGDGDNGDGGGPPPDSGPAAYGAKCSANEDCESTLCFIEEGATEGICTKTCKKLSDCNPVNGKLLDCGELPGGEIGCYPQTYKTVEYTQGHDCSMDGKCAVGYTCVGQRGTAERYCAAKCTSDRSCPPRYRCATTRRAKEPVSQDRLCMLRQFCHPCVIDDQCGEADDLCIKDTNGNHYCGKSCTATGTTCPTFAKCEDAGNNKLQCRHKAGFCFKSFDSDGELCDPCIAHYWTGTAQDMQTIAEEGVCKKDGFCALLDRSSTEAVCLMPCGSGDSCPSSTYGCGTFDVLGGKFCVPITTISGYTAIGSCQP